MRCWCLVFLLLLIPAAAASQDRLADSQDLRALVEEVRQLRQDLRTTTVAAQRVQIALYRVQLQDAAVARVTRVVDDVHSTLASLADARNRTATDLERAKNYEPKTPAERQDIEQGIAQMKQRLEQLAKDQEQGQARASEAEAQLRIEQVKLDNLNSLLDELDRALERLGVKSEMASPPK